MLDKRALEQPDDIAVSFQKRSLSYRDLQKRSTNIAKGLLEHGVRTGEIVALHAVRSIDQIVAVIALLRAGGACLPLDTSYPRERTDYMLSNSKARLFLGTGESHKFDSTTGVQHLPVRSLEEAGARCDPRPLPPLVDSEAYVLYTSGSSGKPKGVVMGHGALAHLVQWQIAVSDGSPTTLQFAPISFDVSFQEIFSTLCGGGKLVLIDDDDRRDPYRLVEVLQAEQVQRLFLPTAALHPFAEAACRSQLNSLRSVIVAGEQLVTTVAVRRFFLSHAACRLHNHYGPTETHVVTSHVLPAETDNWSLLPPIGQALPHAQLFIRHDDGRFVGPGEIGELWIGGASLARGYLEQPELTAERFQDTSFGGRLYRTGDLVRDEAGTLHFCGRADDQVKMRGHRVEVAEIESKLSQHPEVSACAVVALADSSGEKVLVAYVVKNHGLESARAVVELPYRDFLPTWQTYLSRSLPEFMVPAVWVVVESIAKTPSGKIDRSSLPPVPKKRLTSTSPTALPRNALESAMLGIWSDLFQLDEVGVEDSFFDLGGTSLMLIRLQARLVSELGLRLERIDLLNSPTIRSLTGRVSARNESTAEPERDATMTQAVKSNDRSRDIAIVGVACRFPGADSPRTFWENLCQGVESIQHPLMSDVDNRAAGYVSASAQLTDIDKFDAEYFGFSDRDAEMLDPQHRLFLECSVEALEDAGADSVLKVGVFGGCGPSTYLINNVIEREGRSDISLTGTSDGLRLLLGVDKDYLTSHVSYRLNLTGPSVNVNAACATSLYAVHLARQALLNHECDLALAGAACVPVPQADGHIYEPGMVFSPDGRCRPYAADAQGTVFGSGAGVVALRRLDDALRDGDRIYAVIEGSAINNDGANKAGMTTPSKQAQAEVIRSAQRDARLSPADVSCIEGHGTATELGDLVEVSALDEVFGSAERPWCMLGSVKGNVGHLGWAAGMAGLIKTTLAVHHGKIPPTLNCPVPNPLLCRLGSPFSIANVEHFDWQPQKRRVAGISAFGLGGVNAHVVIGQAPVVGEKPTRPDDLQVVTLSAVTEPALQMLVREYHRDISSRESLDIADIAATSTRGRRHLKHRLAFVVHDREELLVCLQEELNASTASGTIVKRKSERVVALFTGQGAECKGMGLELYDRWPQFKRVFDASDALFLENFGRKAKDLLGEGSFELISHAQPLVFTVQMALAALWRSWGVRFDAVIGHSLGEFAAASVAGVFEFEDGLRLVIERGRLLQSLSSDA
ncbi:MAG: amino acid adenylation domain-containing protein, partial [Alphaproteobacteria bacterium]|nr:amino acid adenylation domain-containing protein [Alphaproteobacteria bacterium]